MNIASNKCALDIKLAAIFEPASPFLKKGKITALYCPSPGDSIRTAKQPQNYNGPDTQEQK
jgi:hypothetical protein